MSEPSPSPSRGRVLTVADHLGAIGGTEVAQLEIFEGLAACGWTVHLLYVSPGDLFDRWRAVSASMTRVEASLPARRAPMSSTFGALSALRRARTQRADALYVHSAGDVPLALAVHAGRPAPVVAHLHLPPPYRQPGWLNALIRRAGAVITPSSDTAGRWSAAARIERSRISVIPTGIDVARYVPLDDDRRAAVRTSIGVDDGERMVLFVGRLEEIKGPHFLLDAAQRLEGRVHVVLCGDGRDPEYVGRLERAAAGRRVTFLGRRSDTPDLMGAADLLVVPSNVAETQGLVIGEAMACGTPVVASDAGGLRDSMAGFVDQLVPPADVERLASAIGRTVDWRRDHPDLGERSRAWVVEHLALARTIDAVDELLRGALAKAG